MVDNRVSQSYSWAKYRVVTSIVILSRRLSVHPAVLTIAVLGGLVGAVFGAVSAAVTAERYSLRERRERERRRRSEAVKSEVE